MLQPSSSMNALGFYHLVSRSVPKSLQPLVFSKILLANSISTRVAMESTAEMNSSLHCTI